jgi:hypothetical protein
MNIQLGPTRPTGSSSFILGTIWGQTINWNNITNSWQITGISNLALGNYAGQINQSDNAVAVGSYSGNINQGTNAIAIGNQAGQNTQGTNSIAIGTLAGSTNQAENTIVISATGSVVTGAITNAT